MTAKMERGESPFETFESIRERDPSPQDVTTPDGVTTILGAGVIFVFGPKYTYIAPDLIWHYVTKHHYRPPVAFVRALMTSPLPTEPAFLELLRTRFSGPWDYFEKLTKFRMERYSANPAETRGDAEDS